MWMKKIRRYRYIQSHGGQRPCCSTTPSTTATTTPTPTDQRRQNRRYNNYTTDQTPSKSKADKKKIAAPTKAVPTKAAPTKAAPTKAAATKAASTKAASTKAASTKDAPTTSSNAKKDTTTNPFFATTGRERTSKGRRRFDRVARRLRRLREHVTNSHIILGNLFTRFFGFVLVSASTVLGAPLVHGTSDETNLNATTIITTTAGSPTSSTIYTPTIDMDFSLDPVQAYNKSYL